MPGTQEALSSQFPGLNVSAEQGEQGLALGASCLAGNRPTPCWNEEYAKCNGDQEGGGSVLRVWKALSI